MFEKLRVAKGKETEEFKKYRQLKGTYLHLQVYNLLLEKNGANGVTYRELSSHIRYDKNLRDLLYIYFATLEEWLRAKLLENYDIETPPSNADDYEGHCYNKLSPAIRPKQNKEESLLFIYLRPDFSVLMQICDEKGVTNFTKNTRDKLKDLRNKIMHHSLIMFGNITYCSLLNDYFRCIENRLNLLVK